MQSCVVRHGAVNGATAPIAIGPVKVEFFVFAKSAWNFQRYSALEAGSTFIKKFGEPGGGGADPSRSDGSRLANPLLGLKQTNVGAETPPTMAERSNAHASGPRKLPAPEKMFQVT